MNKRRAASLFLALCLTLPATAVLGGCGDKSGADVQSAQSQSADTTAAENPAESSAETTQVYPEYDADYEGCDFAMLYFDAVATCGWSDLPCDIDEPELTGDVLSDAIYNRNRKIEELYNVSIKTLGYEGTTSACPIIEKQVMAGATDYDAVFPAWNALYGLVSNRYLTDLEPYFDMSMPWYDAKSQSAFSMLGKTYAVISDATYMDKLLSIVILFNQKMVSDYGLGDLYQMVIDHRWTFDEMLGMCGDIYEDLNGDNKYDNGDRYGFISQDDATYELYNGGGQYYCQIGDDGLPYQSQNNELSITVMQKIISFMNDNELFFNRQINGVDTVGICNMFAEDRGLFLLRQIQASFELRNMQADFGVIPTPLMYEGQEDYHTAIGYTVAICEGIPASVRDASMSAVILDTLAAESHYSVNDTLYETILGSKLFRDEKSKENLDIIMDNRIYDPGCVYNFGNIAGDWFLSFTKGADQVASVMEKNSGAIDKAIEKFVTSLKESE